nr:hypothetical protein [Luteimonas suaedae]
MQLLPALVGSEPSGTEITIDTALPGRRYVWLRGVPRFGDLLTSRARIGLVRGLT